MKYSNNNLGDFKIEHGWRNRQNCLKWLYCIVHYSRLQLSQYKVSGKKQEARYVILTWVGLLLAELGIMSISLHLCAQFSFKFVHAGMNKFATKPEAKLWFSFMHHLKLFAENNHVCKHFRLRTSCYPPMHLNYKGSRSIKILCTA